MLQGHRDQPQLRTTRAVGLLTALRLRTTLAVQQEQAEALPPVGRPPTGLVAAQVNQRLRAGLLLTVRHAERLEVRVEQLATPHLGQARLANLRLVHTIAAVPTFGIGITGVIRPSVGITLRFRLRYRTLQHRIQRAVGLTIDMGLGQATRTA